MRRILKSLSITAILVFITPFTPISGLAVLIDVDSPKYEVIDSVAHELDKEGIDAARRLDSPKVRKHKTGRPVLGPLESLNLPKNISVNKADWTQGFKNGAIGGIAAVKESIGGSSESLNAFREKWRKAGKSKRVFISFTGADLEYALKVKTALERGGYVTFIFLKDTKQGPLVSPQEAGRFFKEAGHHFVIDTPNARKSVGVKFEYSLLGGLAAKDAKKGQSGKGQAGSVKPGEGPSAPKSTTPGISGGSSGSPKAKAASEGYKKCQICGARAVGWCHMRNINVCETHRYFTQGGQRWRCP